MVKPWRRASRFSNEAPSEAEEVAEQTARQRDLERQLKYQIERDGGGHRGDTCEDVGAPLVPGERSEHITGRSDINARQRNDTDVKRRGNKEHCQALDLAGPKHD